MGNRISQERYLFTESLAYDLPKNNRKSYICVEILKLIPIISLVNFRDLESTVKNRRFWEKKGEDGYIFDVKFSFLSILKHSVNVIGLGILMVPFRITASCMRMQDKKFQRICGNPHFLNRFRFDMCDMLIKNSKAYYQTLLNFFPEEEDYCRRMAFRDHIQHPEFMYPSLYPDPLGKPSDAAIKQKPSVSHSKSSSTSEDKTLKQKERPRFAYQRLLPELANR